MKKNNIGNFNQDARPSRFMLDLKAKQRKQKAEETELKKSKKPINNFFEQINKFKEFSQNKFCKSNKELNQKKTAESEEKIKKPKTFAYKKRKNLILNYFKNFHLRQGRHLKRMAFFPFFKVFFIAIKTSFKVCHAAGFSVLFIARFIFFFFKKIFSAVAGFKKNKKQKIKTVDINIERIFKHSKKPKSRISNIFKPRKAGYFIPKRFGHLNFKPFLAFLLILIVLTLPFKALIFYSGISNLKDRVFGISANAVEDIKSASSYAIEREFEKADSGFTEASRNFLEAKSELDEISVFLDTMGAIIPNKELKLAKEADLFLEAGSLSAEICAELSRALNVFNEPEASVKKIFDNFQDSGRNLSLKTSQFAAVIKEINAKALPEEYQALFNDIKKKIVLIDENLNEFLSIIDLARIFLGFERDQRYLFVFQNNAELRASGGFIGSFALVDFSNGEIKNMEVPGGGSYDTKGGLYEKIIAPEPLHLVDPQWHFWDANWWPDWPTSAAKLMWFYEKSGGPTVDGIISFTPTVLEKLLETIGEIDMTEEYGIVFNSENVWQILQVISEQKEKDHPDYAKYAKLYKDIIGEEKFMLLEQKNDTVSSSANIVRGTEEIIRKRHEPKKIIGDLMEKIVFKSKNGLNKDMFFGLVDVFLSNLNEKHFMLYFVDGALQKKIIEYGWSGEMKKSNWDYLMVINTNIAGAKTDKVIKEEISHKSSVAEDGTITNTVAITRRHTGYAGDPILGVRNVDWLRVYAPLGSKLLSASGFSAPDKEYFNNPEAYWQQDAYISATEGRGVVDKQSGTKIYQEKYKTVFANWCMVNPGETIVIRLKYVLPFKMRIAQKENNLQNKLNQFLNPEQKDLCPHALLAQKQPGSIGSKFKSELVLPSNFTIKWQYGQDASKQNSWLISDVLNTDKYWAALLEIN
ncbi:DUF4012 domain-containing protein [Candidatus Parcubacteria bacterium]|nr:DUF4012 domain-containing protein [Candidatus Parcubacteria bacterium]